MSARATATEDSVMIAGIWHGRPATMRSHDREVRTALER